MYQYIDDLEYFHFRMCLFGFNPTVEEELYLDIRLIYDIVRGFPGGTSGKKTRLPMQET